MRIWEKENRMNRTYDIREVNQYMYTQSKEKPTVKKQSS